MKLTVGTVTNIGELLPLTSMILKMTSKIMIYIS